LGELCDGLAADDDLRADSGPVEVTSDEIG
jgi:hypothetical protein